MTFVCLPFSLSSRKQEKIYMINKTRLKTNIQYFLPKVLLTRAVGLLASAHLGKATTFIIKQFIKCYKINTKEMELPVESYKTFNDFFARALKKDARPVNKEKNSIIFPVDGTVSQAEKLSGQFMIQAKGHYYSAETLLGGKDGEIFKGGDFTTIYLSPKDYHRVHIPYAGTLERMIYIPGELFSVSPFNAEHIPELFARNERVACIFDTEIGKMAVVFVGATIVRSISTTWAGTVAPDSSQGIKVIDYPENKFKFKKGEEIGRFFMGSTVICLFEKDKINFMKDIKTGSKTIMGKKMAEIRL